MKLQIVLFSIFCSLVLTRLAYADEANCALRTAKTIHYVTDHEDLVWPGIQINKTPILIHFRNSEHIYAYNFTPKNAKWQKVTLDNKPAYYLDSDYDEISNVEVGFKEVDGQNSYVYKFFDYNDENDILFCLRALLSKRFAYYLATHSAFPHHTFAHWKHNYIGFNQIRNAQYLFLEDRILQDYIETHDAETLKNYLATYQYRRSLLSKESAEFESASEIRFEASSYFSFRSLNMDDKTYTEQILRNYAKRLECPAYSDRAQIIFCLTFGHYNLGGPVLGFALDKIAGKGWQAKAENSASSFADLLGTYFTMMPEEASERVKKSEKRYDFSDIKSQLKVSLEPYLEAMAEQEKNYSKAPGIVVNIDNRYCRLHAFTRKPRKNYVVTSKINLITELDEEMKCSLDDGNVSIVYKKIPWVYQYNSVLVNEIKLPVDTSITINDKKQSLGEAVSADQTISFTKLKIESPQAIITIEGNGTYAVKNGVVFIDWPIDKS